MKLPEIAALSLILPSLLPSQGGGGEPYRPVRSKSKKTLHGRKKNKAAKLERKRQRQQR